MLLNPTKLLKDAETNFRSGEALALPPQVTEGCRFNSKDLLLAIELFC